MSAPSKWASARRADQKPLFVPVERAVVDGTFAFHALGIDDEHWAFLVYLYWCAKRRSGTIWPGPTAALTYCGISSQTHAIGLYEPLVNQGFVRVGGLGQRQSTVVREYDLLLTPTLLAQGTLAMGDTPFTESTAKAVGRPFVMLPKDLIDSGAWAMLDHAERRLLCALYAFLTPDDAYGDPNHLRLEHGKLWASEAFLSAAGNSSEGVVRVFSQLESKDLVSTESHRLTGVPMFPGSRPPLVVDDEGSIEARLYVPRLPVPPRRAKRSRKGGVQ